MDAIAVISMCFILFKAFRLYARLAAAFAEKVYGLVVLKLDTFHGLIG